MSFPLASISKEYPALLRCYGFASSRAVHFRSPDTFSDMQALRAFVSVKNRDLRSAALQHQGEEAPTAFLFVQQKHLPQELHSALVRHPAYSYFCQFIVFCQGIYELKVNSQTYPPNMENRARLSRVPTIGFPVTAACPKIIRTSAHSFGIEELNTFLGTYIRYAGRMMFLNLGSPHQGYPAAIQDFLDILSL